jgi:hypothetical protein
MKKKHKSALGLHTMEEQSVALRIVNDAYDAAIQVARGGDMDRLNYLRGFIAGIYELAVAEGQGRLAKQIRTTLETLQSI